MSESPTSWLTVQEVVATAPTRFRVRGWFILGDDSYREQGSFVAVRQGDRWRVDTHGVEPALLLTEATRDLISASGGMKRLPPSEGWAGHPAAALLRPELEALDDLAIFEMVEGPCADSVEGRAALRITLRYKTKEPFRLWIDQQSGLRSRMHTSEGDVWLSSIEANASIDARVFQLLDTVEDIDLDQRMPTPPELVDTVTAISDLTGPGIDVSVRTHDRFADAYTLVLSREGSAVAFFDRRSDEHDEPYSAVFAGRQERILWEPWEYSLDCRDDDPATRLLGRRLIREFVLRTPRTNGGVG